MTEKYRLYRTIARTGDVVIWKGESPLAWAIQKWSGTGSHSGLIIELERRVFLIESNIKGVMMSLASERLKGNWCILQDQIDRQQYEKQRALRKLGSKYDFTSLIIRQPIFIISGGDWMQRPTTYDRSFYCSEFVAYCKRMPGWWATTPNNLLLHKDFYRIIDFD